MLDRGHPAAYIRTGHGDADLARQNKAVAEAARQRGWPLPTVYAEDQADLDDGHAPALARLEAAIEVGRHDALLIADPGAVTATANHLMELLFRCTRNGVAVGFVLPPRPPPPRSWHPRRRPRSLPPGTSRRSRCGGTRRGGRWPGPASRP